MERNRQGWRNTKQDSMKIRRLSGKEKLVIQLQKQHKFIPQTFREFYEDVRADTDTQTNNNDISSGSGKSSYKPY